MADLGVVFGCWCYMLAGLLLVTCFVVAGLIFHLNKLSGAGGGWPVSIFVWTLHLCGMFYMLGSLTWMAIFADAPDGRDFVLKFFILTIGGFLFMLSSYGAAPWCISLRYVLPGRYPADHPYYTRPDSLKDGLPPHPFLNTAAHYGVICFIVGTTWLWAAFNESPGKAALEENGMMQSPWWSTLFLMLGSWVIGVFFLWGPIIAAGQTSFDSLHVELQGMNKIVTCPSFAWMGRLWIAAIGGASLLFGSIIFAKVNEVI
jgi:hypothetical protein